MYLLDSRRSFRLSILVLVLFLGASVCTLAGALTAAAAELRSNETPIDLGTTVRGEGLAAGEPDCFRAEVPGAGLVLLEVAVPGSAEAEPRLGLLSPGRDELRVIARSAKYFLARSRSALPIELCVGAQDPAQRLGEYRLETRFAGLEPRDFAEDDPQIELEPEGLIATLGPGPDFADDPQIELEPEGARTVPLAALCGAADDHGDTLLCSTPLALGGTVAGSIANDWGDDYDVFAFAISAERTVRIRTSGELAARAGLYDRNGQRLATARGEEIRLVRTLAPGLYFVRVEGLRRAEGGYALTVESFAQSW